MAVGGPLGRSARLTLAVAIVLAWTAGAASGHQASTLTGPGAGPPQSLAIGSAGAQPLTSGGGAVGAGETVEPGLALVRFRDGASATAEAQVRSSMGASVLRSYHLVPGLELIKLQSASRSQTLDALAALAHEPGVLYATPDVAYHVQTIPDDPLFSQQWGMESIGAPEAWGRSTGSQSVIVALLDTGITLDHPDLEANIWTNPDPGQDGYVDDVHGWNFVSEDNNPSDDNGHGTHVAGIIGAVGNNGIGVAGINWSVSLMALKICNAEGSCSLGDEIAALEYAVEHGAKVANASFGGAYGGYQPEEEAIRAAGKAGLLYVAAAGNDDSDDDVTPFYPASYPLENIISVAATTRSETLASFSDYGPNSVGIGAPGQGILSTLPASGEYSSRHGVRRTQRHLDGHTAGRRSRCAAVERAPHVDNAANPRAPAQHRASAALAVREGIDMRRARHRCGHQPGDRRTGLTVHRADGHRVGFGQLIAGWCRMRRRWLVQRDVRARNASHADRHAPGRLDLRALARGLHRHGFVHRLTDDGQHRHGGLRHHRGQPGLGRRAAVSPQRARTVRPWIEP